MSDPTIALVAVGLLSISCQYLAYKIRLPAILPLLVVGILVGPVFNVLDADALFCFIHFLGAFCTSKTVVI